MNPLRTFIVSGSVTPFVSGRKSVSTPARREVNPKMRIGAIGLNSAWDVCYISIPSNYFIVHHFSADKGRQDASNPGEGGAGTKPRVPDHGGEHLGRVLVDHGEAGGDEELPGLGERGLGLLAVQGQGEQQRQSA